MFAKNDVFIHQLLADPNYRIQPNGCVEKIINYRDMKLVRGAVKPIWRAVGFIDSTGRKLVHYKRKNLIQARIVWAALIGDLKPDQFILFKDSNEQNLDPKNLISKTFSEIQIKRYQGGQKVSNARLRWNDVQQLRNEWATGEYTQKKLAEKYELSQNAVSLIVNNKTYKRETNHD